MIIKKLFIGFIVVTDLVFIISCFTATRTGMEAMGVIFTILPLAALHLLLAGGECIRQLWNKRGIWFPVYFLVATVLMVYSYHLYVNLEPKGYKIYRILSQKIHRHKDKLSTYKDDKSLQIRQLLERTQNRNHADLCRALAHPQDLTALEETLKKGTDLNLPCALTKGRSALPTFVILAENYPLWRKKSKPEKAAELKNIRASLALLLDYGAVANSRDEYGNTALHWTFQYEDERMAALLIDHNACVFIENKRGQRILRKKGPSAVMKVISTAALDPELLKNCPQFAAQQSIPKKNDPISKNQPPKDKATKQYWTKKLRHAASTGNLSLAAEAIGKGAEINNFNRQDNTALHLATKCRKEMPAMIEMLLAVGANVDSRTRHKFRISLKESTPLIAAARNVCPDSVTLLLKKGADPNLNDNDGYTAMHHIAFSWPPERMAPSVDLLLKAGADINARDKIGRTPLMMTAYTGSDEEKPETVFLSRGADPDLKDHNGNTFLHQLILGASRKDPTIATSSLIQYGAIVDLRNRAGMTPLMLAEKKHKLDIVKQLLETGAKVNQEK